MKIAVHAHHDRPVNVDSGRLLRAKSGRSGTAWRSKQLDPRRRSTISRVIPRQRIIRDKARRQFVADDPPPDFVETLAGKFRDSDGDPGRHCHSAPGLRRSRWPGSRTRMNKISYSGIVPARDHSASNMALPPIHPEPARRRRFIGGARNAVSYETVRRWVNHFGPMIAADLRKRRLKPHTAWHLDEVYLKIDGRMVYLWRAVDAEGEVLDVLVQSSQNKPAALRLMRKLLKKYAFAPEWLVTDDLRSYSAAVRDLGIERGTSAGDGKTIEPEFASADAAAGAQDAAVQEPGLSPEISFHTRRHLQYLQRPTPSHLSPNTPRASRFDRCVHIRPASTFTLFDRTPSSRRMASIAIAPRSGKIDHRRSNSISSAVPDRGQGPGLRGLSWL